MIKVYVTNGDTIAYDDIVGSLELETSGGLGLAATVVLPSGKRLKPGIMRGGRLTIALKDAKVSPKESYDSVLSRLIPIHH